MTKIVNPPKVTRKRSQVAGSQRQRCKVIAETIGAHRNTVQRWELEGKLKYRIHRFLADQFELGKHDK